MQITFGYRYSARAVRHICGDEASKCSDAFYNWIGAQPRNIDQLVADKVLNMYDGLYVGFNEDASTREINTTLH